MKVQNYLDKGILLLTCLTITFLCFCVFCFSKETQIALDYLRNILGDKLSPLTLYFGIIVFLVSLFLIFSKYGNIKLINKDKERKKERIPFITWGSMIFSCGLASDIIFYSFSEWMIYLSEPYVESKGNAFKLANVYAIFHWSLIPWSFYLVLAVCFGYLLHVKNSRREKISVACFPLIPTKYRFSTGRIIDAFAIFALIAGTATTFSIATPLMSDIICSLLGIDINRTLLNVAILLITFVIYTTSTIHGIKGLSICSKICMLSFVAVLIYVFAFGGKASYILENTASTIGYLCKNFFSMSVYTDPKREFSFPQNYTVFYWSYWIAWSIVVPFFIAKISRGRSVRELIIGGYLFGCGCTVLCFSILGNYSLGHELDTGSTILEAYRQSQDLYYVVKQIMLSLPYPKVFMSIVLFSMIIFYSTSFDSIAYSSARYSYKFISSTNTISKKVQFTWCVLLIILPIAQQFSDDYFACIQNICIIAAFPMLFIITLVIVSFLKEAYLVKTNVKNQTK